MAVGVQTNNQRSRSLRPCLWGGLNTARHVVPGEKGRDLTQSYDKSPCTNRKFQKSTWQRKNTTKNFDYTTIADRLNMVNCSNDSYITGVVKPVYKVPTFLLTAKAVWSKRHTRQIRRHQPNQSLTPKPGVHLGYMCSTKVRFWHH